MRGWLFHSFMSALGLGQNTPLLALRSLARGSTTAWFRVGVSMSVPTGRRLRRAATRRRSVAGRRAVRAILLATSWRPARRRVVGRSHLHLARGPALRRESGSWSEHQECTRQHRKSLAKRENLVATNTLCHGAEAVSRWRGDRSSAAGADT